MTLYSKALPSTTALRAFEAAARHLSFTTAANDLEQTQGAVSHQIRELETRLGVKLFNREPRGITLSDSGQTYLPYVRDALNRLRAGEQALRPPVADNVLTVSCSPNFAQKWLVPRLGSFMQDNPTLELRISASPQHVTFQGDGIDIAIRHGDGCWPDLAVTRLCKEWIFPVCSPYLSPSVTSINSIKDFSKFVLIHDQQREGWASWLRHMNASPEDFDLESGPILSQTSLAIDAAIAAQGIALARSALATLDLRANRLVRPTADKAEADFAYWIISPKQNHSHPTILRFKNWLLKQVSSDAAENRDISIYMGHGTTPT